MVQSDTILSILPVVCSGKLSLAWFISNAKVIYHCNSQFWQCLYYYLKSIYALKTLVYKNIPFAYFSASIKPILQLGIVLDISTWNLHLDKTHKMASLVP